MTEHHDNPDDQALSAYLDGELPREQADRLTERLAAEPLLARRLEELRSADPATRQAFHAIDELPLPQGVLDLVGADDAEPRRAGRDVNVMPFPLRVLQSFLQVPVAVAASLALAAGFLASGPLRDDPSPGYELVARTVPAGSALDRFLETGTSAAPAALAGEVRGELLLTFEDRSGAFCRQLRLTGSADAMQGVACRRGGRWQMEVASFGSAPGTTPPGQYQAASGERAAAVDAAIDALIGEREPLDAEAEHRLVRSGWQKDPN